MLQHLPVRRLRTIITTLLLGALLAGCGNDDDAGVESTTPAEEPAGEADNTGASPTTTASADAATDATAATTDPPTTTAASPAAPATAGPPPTTTTTVAEQGGIQILVTNDDGVEAPGIDVLVNALLEIERVGVTVVAPAENQSGSSDSTTDGPVANRPATTASGVEATAVEGFPADAVVVALDELGVEPDLVVSGVNEGQNIGPFVELSGTVGAARTAARRGIPAVAASAGLPAEGQEAAFEETADLVVEWLVERIDELAVGDLAAGVTSFNAPTCAPGTEIRGLVEVPVAAAFPADVNPFDVDCSSTVENPADDYLALSNGFAAVTDVGLG